jgi:hypothetical protein
VGQKLLAYDHTHNLFFVHFTQFEEKLEIKQLGPDRPDINNVQQTKDRGKTYNISFSRAWYENK